MRKKNIFWGIFFVLAAVAVVVTQLGIVRHISVWAVLATAFWIWVLAESVRHRRFYGIMFSIAFLSIIYDKKKDIRNRGIDPLAGTCGSFVIIYWFKYAF